MLPALSAPNGHGNVVVVVFARTVMSAIAEKLYRIHRFSVADYNRLGEVGLLTEDDRVELIEGEIIDMPPIGSRHARAVNYLNMHLVEAVRRSAVVAVQNPVALDEHTEVQPDVAVLRMRADLYGVSHPRPRDVLLIIEVADTTVRYDLDIQLPLYARAGIAEVWVVDLEVGVLRLFRDPGVGEYREKQELGRRGAMAIPHIPAATIDLSGLFEP
jgi:Uma2 family endonuclease